MDLLHSTGQKCRNAGGILNIFSETMQQIGGTGSGKVFNQPFPRS
jgi:hypothetical protein